MNEVSSFCDGSWYVLFSVRMLQRPGLVLNLGASGSGADLSDTSMPFPLPGAPGALITDYPEW
jgi:hypothetical protein